MADSRCQVARMVQQQRQRRVPSRQSSRPCAGRRIQWKTFGANITSRVITFEPPHELGWDARGVLRAYHGWIIEPDGHGGCRVVTEECQNGIVPKVAWWYLRPMLERGHQNWVESLKRVAEGGDPS